MATSKPRKRSREPMSRVDTAWLRMERPTNPMMITGVLMFAEPMSLKALKQAIKQRFLAYSRFRQKSVDTPGGAYWQDDEHFDLDWHVRESALPGKGDKKSLERFVSQLASSPLDTSKPLWQFHLVERYDGGSAVVARIHHSYADGIALVQVLLSLTDTSRHPVKGSELSKAWLKQDGADVARRVGAVDRYMKLGGKVIEQGMAMYRDPSLAGVIAKEGGEIARELLHALSLPDDPPSMLRGKLGVSKRVAWAEPLDLEEVKAVGRACDCTVNDVLMAAAAGALRDYMLERGESVDGMTLRATVPVNLRPLEHAKKLGNHFGLVFLDLPVGESNPIRRLEHVAECMNQLKNSRQAIVAFGLLAALGMAPTAGAGARAGDVQPQGHRGRDQRARAAAAAVHGWLHVARDDVLGAADRFDRHRHFHPQLQRPRAFRFDRRCETDTRPGRGDPSLRPRVRQDVVPRADGQLG